MNIITARRDPKLFGAMYRDPSTWRAWDAVLKGIFAMPMDASEKRAFRRLAQRKPPRKPVREAWIIAGRRGGKTSTAAEIAAYLAAFSDYRALLRPGETAVVPLLAVDREQAKVALNYIRALFRIPMLAKMVTRETGDGLELNNGAAIQVHTNSFRHVRGRTLAGAIFDEVAYWRDSESATPDKETYRAVLPGLATLDGSLLIGISSPYRRAGLLFEKYQQHFGRDDSDILVIQAPSRALNPSLDKRVVDQGLADDPAAAAAEWLAQFRDDITGYFDPADVDAAVAGGLHAMAPRDGVTYRAFCDPAGTGKDEFTLAIGHLENKRRIVDLVAGKNGKPHPIVADFSAVLKQYRCRSVTGDKYAAGWVKDTFHDHGIAYSYATKTRSEIYLETAPLFTTGMVTIPEDKKLLLQLKQLERRTARGGRDQVDHPPGGHDDRANAVCGLLEKLKVMKRTGPICW